MADTTDNKKETKEKKVQLNKIRKAKGLYNVTFLEDHGSYEENDKAKLHHSTALALEAHGVVKVGTKVKVVRNTKNDDENK